MGILASRKWLAIAAFSLFIAIMNPLSGWAQNSQPVELFEEKIKAGLVYNFLKYTAWPDTSTDKSNLRVCLFGEDTFNGYLSPLSGRRAQQFVIHVTHIDNIKETANCQLVFISRSEKGSLQDLLGFLKNKHVLTVSDMDNFARQGGMIELAKEDERITFYINTKAVGAAGLSIQGHILKLAKLVSG